MRVKATLRLLYHSQQIIHYVAGMLRAIVATIQTNHAPMRMRVAASGVAVVPGLIGPRLAIGCREGYLHARGVVVGIIACPVVVFDFTLQANEQGAYFTFHLALLFGCFHGYSLVLMLMGT